MNDLQHRHCTPLEGGQPLSADEVQSYLRDAPGWTRDGGAIVKRYDFANYHETLAFVNALAWIAHREDHHPELTVTYNRCVVRFDTHSVGGISINDFICAAKVDALSA